jgi:hypothetical protein
MLVLGSTKISMVVALRCVVIVWQWPTGPVMIVLREGVSPPVSELSFWLKKRPKQSMYPNLP